MKIIAKLLLIMLALIDLGRHHRCPAPRAAWAIRGCIFALTAWRVQAMNEHPRVHA